METGAKEIIRPAGGVIIPDLKAEVSGAWHTLRPERVLTQVSASVDGLSSEEAAIRLKRHGRNELREATPINPWAILLGQFKSLIVWLLIVAAIISGLMGEWIDCVAIIAIVILNAIVGFYQEFNAEKSLAALKKMTAPHAKVKRDGTVQSVSASEVVPGDIVVLDAGDLVPADARILDAHGMKCVEAALTGESEAVEKRAGTLAAEALPLGDRANIVYMDTSVGGGTAETVVFATGMNTEIGKIASLIAETGNDETPLQKRLQSFGRMLVWASLGIVGVVFVLGLLRRIPVFELFLTSVSLAVAAVPEGLPAVVTVALALGVQRMARRRALVRKLPAVETLGSTNIICTDKTGTLTVGEMTVRCLFIASEMYSVTGEGYCPEGAILFQDRSPSSDQTERLREFLTVLIGCNDAHLRYEKGKWNVIGDPTEGALLTVGRKLGLEKDALEKDLLKVHTIPFDSERKLMTVVRRMKTGALSALVKGAPDILLQRCTHILTREGIREINAADRQNIATKTTELANSALRVLATGFRPVNESEREGDAPQIEQGLVFAGLTGMYDPPRPEAKEAVARCRSAGIRVVMITGDHPSTALAIARELGITRGDDLAMSGKEIDALTAEQFARQVIRVAVFARVTAAHKLKIVRALKANGAVVAMTGDGVNDAPAIKGANIGIAMGKSGTEVTKEASDMVITDDNFASIVAAIEEGRGIFDNIKKTMQYLLAGNSGELLLMAVCVMAGLPMPLLAIHLLWINLVTDGLPALCLATDPIDPDVMKRAPRRSDAQFADRPFLVLMISTGILTAAVSLAVYLYGLKYETVEMARTHAFATLVFAELLRSFGCRSETKMLWQIGLLSNLKLALVVSVSFAFQVLSHHSRTLGAILKTETMDWSDCLMLLAISTLPLIVLEIVKFIKHGAGHHHLDLSLETKTN